MKLRTFYALALFGALAFGAFALQLSTARAMNDVNTLAIGTTIKSFALPDSDGKAQTLDSLKGKYGTAIIFTSAQCPVVKAYNERIAQFATDYQAKGINVVGINSNSTESAADMKNHAATYHQNYVMLRDAGNKIADQFGAQYTPEVFLFDADNKLVYHGGVDDSKDTARIANSYLREAADALIAGKAIAKPESKAFGCTIKRANMR